MLKYGYSKWHSAQNNGEESNAPIESVTSQLMCGRYSAINLGVIEHKKLMPVEDLSLHIPKVIFSLPLHLSS